MYFFILNNDISEYTECCNYHVNYCNNWTSHPSDKISISKLHKNKMWNTDVYLSRRQKHIFHHIIAAAVPQKACMTNRTFTSRLFFSPYARHYGTSAESMYIIPMFFGSGEMHHMIRIYTFWVSDALNHFAGHMETDTIHFTDDKCKMHVTQSYGWQMKVTDEEI